MHNPDAVPVAVEPFATDDDGSGKDDIDPVTVGAGATVTIPWPEVIAVPQNC